jgi:uncharacterized protein YjbI with pentapeptide repeats
MANEKHLEILKQGVAVWNEWRINNFEVIPDLHGADLSKANLSEADLSEAILSRATIIETDLSGAFLNRANLSEANLSCAKLTGAFLNATFLHKTQLGGAILRNAHLRGAKLNRASLIEADLSGADLSGADLQLANLQTIQAVNANFNRATLTGACIEDWWINSATDLEGVICDYIYLKANHDFFPLVKPQERRPHNGNFAPGEFTKLFQEIEDTIDLIFRNGINWRAFAIAFNEVNTKILELNEEVGIFLREYKVLGDGLIALKVTAPLGSDKDKLRDELMCAYKKIAGLEGELKATNNFLTLAFERLLLPSTQINKGTFNIQNIQSVEGNANLMSEAKKEYTFNASVGSVENQGHIASSGNQNTIGNAAGEAQADLKSIQHIHNYAPEQKQRLVEAATEIQQLLKQLEQTNPGATETEKVAYVNDETTASFKRRVVAALQATGEAAIDEFVLENKYLKVVKAAVKGWMKPE